MAEISRDKRATMRSGRRPTAESLGRAEIDVKIIEHEIDLYRSGQGSMWREKFFQKLHALVQKHAEREYRNEVSGLIESEMVAAIEAILAEMKDGLVRRGDANARIRSEIIEPAKPWLKRGMDDAELNRLFPGMDYVATPVPLSKSKGKTGDSELAVEIIARLRGLTGRGVFKRLKRFREERPVVKVLSRQERARRIRAMARAFGAK